MGAFRTQILYLLGILALKLTLLLFLLALLFLKHLGCLFVNLPLQSLLVRFRALHPRRCLWRLEQPSKTMKEL